MRIQLISDLHTEFYVQPMHMVPKIPIDPAIDVLVIAGDLVVPARQNPKNIQRVFEYFSKQAPHVLYVTGNHEYYGGTREQVDFVLKSYMPKNFLWLDNSDVTIDGQHFYGGQMWFKYDPLNQLYEDAMSDFHVIRGDFRKWVYEENTKFRENGRKLITKDTVVISHHLPNTRSTPGQYLGSTLNRFFVSDESALIMEKEPRYWLHGHTHTLCRYFLGDTEVVCYPYAYPHERPVLGERQQKYLPEVIEI